MKGNMKKLIVLVVGCFCWVPAALAQLEISATMPQQSYLLFEGIPVEVNIDNRSGETLQLGGQEPNAVLRFVVRNTRNQIVHRSDVPLHETMWVIPDGIRSARTFDLVQLYDIRRANSYRCEVRLVALDEQFSPPPLLFSVKSGTEQRKIRRRNVDRSFALISVNRAEGDDLMLRVSDYTEQDILGTYSLERVMLFLPPQMEMDDRGNLHILFYRTNRVMVYCLFDRTGEPVLREYLRPTVARPELVRHPELGFWVPGAEDMDTRPRAPSAPPAEAGEE